MRFRLRGEGDEITENDVMDVAGVVPEAAVNNLITTCHSNSFDKVQEVHLNNMDFWAACLFS